MKDIYDNLFSSWIKGYNHLILEYILLNVKNISLSIIMSALWQQDGAYYGSLLDCHFLSSARSSSTLVRIKLHNPAWAPCKSHPETRWMVSNWQMHHIHPAWHSLDKKLSTTCEFRVKSVPCECKEGNAHVSLP